MFCWCAFPLASALRSTGSAAERSALFAGFLATMASSDFPRPYIIGVGIVAFPMRTLGAYCHRSDAGSPRFRRAPFLRDAVFDPGRASAPRKTVPHMLPSTLLTASASANFWISWLNSAPHRIVVYASLPPSPATAQHSLSGARYGLPEPDLHRQDHASFPGAQAIQGRHVTRGHGRFAALAHPTVFPELRLGAGVPAQERGHVPSANILHLRPRRDAGRQRLSARSGLARST